MKVACIFSTTGHSVSYKLGKMILPQLEQGIHGAQVVAMFFFDDNVYALRAGDPLGERLAHVAKEQQIVLMLCDQCALERGLAELEEAPPVDAAGDLQSPLKTRPKGTVAGIEVGCFPDLYAAMREAPPDHVIAL